MRRRHQFVCQIIDTCDPAQRVVAQQKFFTCCQAEYGANMPIVLIPCATTSDESGSQPHSQSAYITLDGRGGAVTAYVDRGYLVGIFSVQSLDNETLTAADIAFDVEAAADFQLVGDDLVQTGDTLGGSWILPFAARFEPGTPPTLVQMTFGLNGDLADVALVFPPAPCPGDADGNRAVEFPDITSILRNFGTSYAPGTGPGDADSDGSVGFADITSVLRDFGVVCP